MNIITECLMYSVQQGSKQVTAVLHVQDQLAKQHVVVDHVGRPCRLQSLPSNPNIWPNQARLKKATVRNSQAWLAGVDREL
jgi:hypothetical protein